MLQAGLRCSGTTQTPFSSRIWLQSAQCRHRISSCIRSNSSDSRGSPSPQAPTSTPSSSTKRKRKRGDAESYWNPPPLPNLVLPRRTICIKGWTPFANMVEIFAVLRSVELKYGTIVEYHATRDFEIPEKPFAMIFAAFADPNSFKRVPPGGIELAIPEPAYKHRPGGVGWDDIENLLGEVDRDPDFERNHEPALSERPGHVQKYIHVRVSPSRKELNSFAPPPEMLPSPEMQRQIAERFLEWGRTQPLTPLNSKRPILDKELFGESSLSSVRLRAALRWAAQALGKRSPHEIYPEDTEEPPGWKDPQDSGHLSSGQPELPTGGEAVPRAVPTRTDDQKDLRTRENV